MQTKSSSITAPLATIALQVSVFTLIVLAWLVIAATTGQAQTFPLTSSLWVLDPQQPDQVQPYNKKGDLAFDFPVIPSPSYAGYLLLPWTQPLTGSTFSAEVQVVTYPFRAHAVYWIAPENGGCESPSKVYLFFQTQGLYNGIEGTQWWASLDAWEIVDTLGGTVVITAALDDPSRWYSVFGHPATQFPAQFANAKAHPSYVGLTFGGNCANAHGIQSKRGDSRFRLRSFGVF